MKNLLLALVALLLAAPAAPAAEAEEVFAALGPVRLLGDGPHRLALGAGTFDMFDDDQSAVAQVDLRCGRKLGFVGPMAGVLANTGGGVMGYLGLYADAAVGRLVLTLQTGAGAYENGGGNDLGGTLEFISGLTVAYRLESGARVGARVEHVSNANIHEVNPGTDLLLLHYDLPF